MTIINEIISYLKDRWTFFTIAVIVFSILYILISIAPKDIRTEYETLFDNCTNDVYEKYLTVYSHGRCDILISNLLENGWEINSSVNNGYGTVIGYVLTRT